MGRKSRRKGDRAGLRRMRGTDKERVSGPSPATLRMTILLAALVAVVLLTIVMFYPGGLFNKPDNDDDGDGNNGNHGTDNPPVAKASATPATVFVGENVTYDGSRSYDKEGRIVNYTWEFHQDVLTGKLVMLKYERKFNLTFQEPGTYFVVLTVEDERGKRNSTVSVNPYNGLTVAYENRPPVAVAGPPRTVGVGDQVDFDGGDSADKDGTIVEYKWDFGDDHSATGVLVSHVYNTKGIYTAMLTVVDDHGGTSSDTVKVQVE